MSLYIISSFLSKRFTSPQDSALDTSLRRLHLQVPPLGGREAFRRHGPFLFNISSATSTKNDLRVAFHKSRQSYLLQLRRGMSYQINGAASTVDTCTLHNDLRTPDTALPQPHPASQSTFHSFLYRSNFKIWAAYKILIYRQHLPAMVKNRRGQC